MGDNIVSEYDEYINIFNICQYACAGRMVRNRPLNLVWATTEIRNDLLYVFAMCLDSKLAGKSSSKSQLFSLP